MSQVEIVIGLGSNVGDRKQQLILALREILFSTQTPLLTEFELSPVFETPALLPEGAPESWQRPFYNMALKGKTTLPPEDLLARLHHIEEKMGRKRLKKWEPRTIDLDLLVYGQTEINKDHLTLPHPGISERSFVLWPLAYLLPDFCFPDLANKKLANQSIKSLVERFKLTHPQETTEIQWASDIGPSLIGILNITPDSFSDGGKFQNAKSALAQAIDLVQQGARVLDIGAESTRPGAKTISPDEEWQRLKPVLSAIKDHFSTELVRPKICVDTRNALTAEQAIELGTDWINDVSGLDNPKMRQIIKNSGVKTVFMHHLGVPPDKNKTLDPNKDTIEQLLEWGKQRKEDLLDEGLNTDQLIFDPGLGFGKTIGQNLEILRRCNELKVLELPIYIGHSRKSLFNLFTNQSFDKRDFETAFVSGHLAHQVDFLRVHDVKLNHLALKMSLCSW